MLRRSPKQRRTAVPAKVPRQFVAAVRKFCKGACLSGNYVELASLKRDVDAEGASSDFPAVFAVTIPTRSDWLAARNPHRTTKARGRKLSRHMQSFPNLVVLLACACHDRVVFEGPLNQSQHLPGDLNVCFCRVGCRSLPFWFSSILAEVDPGCRVCVSAAHQYARSAKMGADQPFTVRVFQPCHPDRPFNIAARVVPNPLPSNPRANSAPAQTRAPACSWPPVGEGVMHLIVSGAGGGLLRPRPRCVGGPAPCR